MAERRALRRHPDPDADRDRHAAARGAPAGRRPVATPHALAPDVSAETSQGQARALLADLLDWHRREDEPAWWRYFYLRTLSPAELTGEPDTLGGLTGGDVVDRVKRSVVRRFRLRDPVRPPPGRRGSCQPGLCPGPADDQSRPAVNVLPCGRLPWRGRRRLARKCGKPRSFPWCTRPACH